MIILSIDIGGLIGVLKIVRVMPIDDTSDHLYGWEYMRFGKDRADGHVVHNRDDGLENLLAKVINEIVKEKKCLTK